MTGRVTFTLDLEDHRAPDSTEERYPALTRRILDFLGNRGVRGTFFVTGEIAERSPDLVREVAAAGHEIGFHGWHHVPLPRLTPVQLRADAKRGKDLLEDVSGTPVVGFRAPLFSLVPESRWAVDVLAEVGFTYSSSVLPARNPLFGDPTAPVAAFRWPNGLIELPCPVARVAGVGLPYLGGVYLRALPTVFSTAARRRLGDQETLWIYCHPYDFDPDEAFWIAPEVGRFGSRLLFYNRRRMFAKVDALLRAGVAPPLVERLAALEAAGLPEWGDHVSAP
jgi:polysaccharide deacetylase family protein (PEP-CTERM system associated)